MRDSLGLHEADDSVDCRERIERAFAVRFRPGEAEACHTAGDVLDLLGRHLHAGSSQACATAMAFYRLRSALPRPGDAQLRPGCALAELNSNRPIRSLLAGLERDTGLTMPTPMLGLLGTLGACMVVASLLSAAWGLAASAWPPSLLALGLAGCGWLLLRHAPARLPPDCATLGNLSRRVAGLNFGALHDSGAAPRRRAVWDALTEVLSDQTGIPANQIGPTTLLAGPSRRAA